jgi:hypothetical protein
MKAFHESEQHQIRKKKEWAICIQS